MNKDLDRHGKKPCKKNPLLVLLAAVVLAATPAGAAVDLVTNGNFEAGFVPDGVCDLLEPDNDQLPLSWNCLETFWGGGPEPSLISSSAWNGPSAPGLSSVKFFRSDRCHLSGDWTSIEQAINRDITACRSLVMNLDVMLVPMVPPASHNLGGSGHAAGPCDPSGWEYPATVQVDYTDTTGTSQCWQYGWYQYQVTQAGLTDTGCLSGFDGLNAGPSAAVSQQIPTGAWIANAFDLLAMLPGVQTVNAVRIGGSGWSFDAQMDNLQILCEEDTFICEQSPWPECGGDCPPETVCVEDPFGAPMCICVDAPPCEQSPWPECGGFCPPGLVCVEDDSGMCHCEPPACEQSSSPDCGGQCPPGTLCVPDSLTNKCICEQLPCDDTFPDCGGACPPGTVCAQDAVGQCLCVPVQCEAGPFPECFGDCPPGTACVPDTANGVCFCERLLCDQSYPACDGDCPPSTVCVSDPTGAGCFCEPLPCEQSYPACDGDCPPSTVCVSDPTGAGCFCEPLPCEQTYPACDGHCPPSTVCVSDPTGAGCFCEPLPCEQTYPACDGDCPPSTVCVSDPTGAGCFCEPLPCEQTYPACDGDCPPSTVCVSDPTGAGCFCEPLPCEQSPWPQCGGECPPGTACVPDNLTGACRCEPLPCEQTFPECGGDCPPGTHCETTAGAVVLPTPDLPPEPNPPDCDQLVSQYAGTDVLVRFPGGIDLSDPVHRCFQNVQRTTDPVTGDEIETFDSILDGLVDVGAGPQPVRLSGPVTTVVRGKGTQTTGTWDTEMVSMSLRGSLGSVLIEIRESPVLASLGQTSVIDLGGGLYHIDSFFDVFTELSVDGGPFEPQLNAPARMELVSTTADACECVPDLCEQSPWPQCGGECPPGTACVPDNLTGACRCEPLPCEQTFPECGGDCPPGTHCETTAGAVVLPTPDLPPEPNPPDCDQLVSQYAGTDVHVLFPGGIDLSDPVHRCFQNVQRTTDPATGDEIETFDSILDGLVDVGAGPQPVRLSGPVTTVVRGKGTQTTGTWDTEMVSMSLSGSLGPVLIEIRESPVLASLGQTSVIDLGGGLYQIDSFFDVFTELSVDGGPFEPQLNAPARMELVSTTPDACECVPDLCEQSPWPQCGGECPPDQVCVDDPTGVQGCICEPLPCEQSAYPQCGGECPPGEVCVDDATGSCRCEPEIVPCEQSPYPECGGACPAGTECIPDPVTGECRCLPFCGDTFFPECDGFCPPNEECINTPGTDFCECVPQGPACEDTFAPECGGWCPPDERCNDVPGTPLCECVPCLFITPGVVQGVHWIDSVRMRWHGLPCATVYNVYQLVAAGMPDTDGDGVADTYGTCFRPDLPVPELVDPSAPPLGIVQFYQVTGENPLGEGSMGQASNGGPRPNVFPCP